jgi:putative tryptophan/tyrosine transport system substrate-binding protein
MIDRRTLLRGAGAAIVPALVPSRAQLQGRPARIGYISFRPGPNEFEQAFLRGLRERGWVEGQNLLIDFRWAAFDAQRVATMVAELLALQPALMVVADSGGARGMIRSQNPAMPIVAPAFGDPIAQGITSNLARPDGNATGSSVFATELAHKRLELLKEAVPGLRRAAALYNSAAPPAVGVAVSVDAGKDLGIEVVAMPVRLPEGITAAFAEAVRQGVQGVAIVSSTATITHRAPLCELSLAHRLPTIFANRTYLRGGGLMSYGPDLEGAFHRGAYFVDRILKGAKPAELPIEQPSTFQLVLNQVTAKAMGVRFPQSLLLRADEVIQ